MMDTAEELALSTEPDPDPDEITDPLDPDFVEPAYGCYPVEEED